MTNSSESQVLWNQIVADFRHACLLRQVDKNGEAAQLLEQELPQAIARWSQTDRRSAREKQTALKAMFAAEQIRAEASLYAPELLAAKLGDVLAPALRQQVGRDLEEGLRRHFHSSSRSTQPAPYSGRIRFDDIPAVIDALLAEQRADHAPRPALAY